MFFMFFRVFFVFLVVFTFWVFMVARLFMGRFHARERINSCFFRVFHMCVVSMVCFFTFMKSAENLSGVSHVKIET